MPQPPDIGDKGGGYADDATLYIQPTPAHKTDPDPLATSRSASLVGLRRMMFENISVANTKTDDEKLPLHKRTDLDLVGGDKSDFSDKPKLSDKSVALGVNNKCSDRLSDFRSDAKSDGMVDQSKSVVKSDAILDESVLGKSDLSSDDDHRPTIVVTQSSLDNSNNEQGNVDSTKEFSSLDNTIEVLSSLHVGDKNIVEAENKILIESQINLEVDSDLEPDSSSSDMPIVQAKNHLVNKADDEIEYRALTDSKESLESKVVEAKNSEFDYSDFKDSKSLHSDTEGLLSRAESESLKDPEEEAVKIKDSATQSLLTHAESGSLKDTEENVVKTEDSEKKVLLSQPESESVKDPEEEVMKNEDEFSSLTHNIEQLVIEAKNDIVNIDLNVPESHERDDENVSSPKIPTPTKRLVKHKPPVPQNRKAQEVSLLKGESTKPADEYPDDLNPFGDDEEEEDREERPEEKRKPSAASLNPFGSSDEEEEEVKTPEQKPVPKPATRKVIPAPKVNLNPFWSGDEEEEEDNDDSLPPVPTPR